MESIYILIPVSLAILAVVIWLFFWATKSGQFDDLESPGLDILKDNDFIHQKNKSDPKK